MAKKKQNSEEEAIEEIEGMFPEDEQQLGIGAFVSTKEDTLSRKLRVGFAMMNGEPVSLR